MDISSHTKKWYAGYILLFALLVSCSQTSGEVYVCPPCGCAAHENRQTFNKDGKCPHCGMSLMEKIDTSRVNQAEIETGSGNYLMEVGGGEREDTIAVYYHRPEKFTGLSPVLLVLPGSGRDAAEYRDSWIASSERYGILVLSPRYPEGEYDFGGYHMGGVMENLLLEENVTYAENSNEVFLDEEDFGYEVNAKSGEWIFNDFDRIFEMAVKATGSSAETYDLFGHSAGGQILHRLVLFSPPAKANRIVASNSGFYTMPEFGAELPFGLGNTPLAERDLQDSFRQQLILLIGEEDDENERGGILLRSPSADKQGTHRLARGRYFYDQARSMARKLKFDFHWQLKIISGVGHDFEKMGEAAAGLLYGNSPPNKDSGE